MPSRPVPESSWAATVRAVAALLPIALIAACGTVKSPTEPPLVEGEGEAFTFARLQAEVFTPSCAKAGCHVTATATGGLVLEAGRAYAEIVDRAAVSSALDRVEPGDPERSYLLKKVRGDADITGARMPFDGPPYLSPEQIAGIAGWIRAGAPAE